MASARTIATRCCWPPERRGRIGVALLGQADARQQRLGALDRLGAAAGLRTRDRRLDDVLQHRHVRPEIVALEHHADLRAAAPAGRRLRVAAMRSAKSMRARRTRCRRRWASRAVDAAQERALARAARADDGDHLADPDVERDAADDFQLAEALAQVADADQGRLVGDPPRSRQNLDMPIVGCRAPPLIRVISWGRRRRPRPGPSRRAADMSARPARRRQAVDGALSIERVFMKRLSAAGVQARSDRVRPAPRAGCPYSCDDRWCSRARDTARHYTGRVIPASLRTDRCGPVEGAKGANAAGLGEQRVPGGATGIQDVVVSRPQAM